MPWIACTLQCCKASALSLFGGEAGARAALLAYYAAAPATDEKAKRSAAAAAFGAEMKRKVEEAASAAAAKAAPQPPAAALFAAGAGAGAGADAAGLAATGRALLLEKRPAPPALPQVLLPGLSGPSAAPSSPKRARAAVRQEGVAAPAAEAAAAAAAASAARAREERAAAAATASEVADAVAAESRLCLSRLAPEGDALRDLRIQFGEGASMGADISIYASLMSDAAHLLDPASPGYGLPLRQREVLEALVARLTAVSSSGAPPVGSDDEQLLEWLYGCRVNFCVVVTICDAVGGAAGAGALQQLLLDYDARRTLLLVDHVDEKLARAVVDAGLTATVPRPRPLPGQAAFYAVDAAELCAAGMVLPLTPGVLEMLEVRHALMQPPVAGERLELSVWALAVATVLLNLGLESYARGMERLGAPSLHLVGIGAGGAGLQHPLAFEVQWLAYRRTRGLFGVLTLQLPGMGGRLADAPAPGDPDRDPPGTSVCRALAAFSALTGCVVPLYNGPFSPGDGIRVPGTLLVYHQSRAAMEGGLRNGMICRARRAAMWLGEDRARFELAARSGGDIERLFRISERYGDLLRVRGAATLRCVAQACAAVVSLSRVDTVDGRVFYRLECEGAHTAYISRDNGRVFDDAHAQWR